jgi:hypothetical protein
VHDDQDRERWVVPPEPSQRVQIRGAGRGQLVPGVEQVAQQHDDPAVVAEDEVPSLLADRRQEGVGGPGVRAADGGGPAD